MNCNFYCDVIAKTTIASTGFTLFTFCLVSLPALIIQTVVVVSMHAMGVK